MKSIRLLTAGMGVLAVQTSFASDRLAPAPGYKPLDGQYVIKEEALPQPAEVAHRVGVTGLHIVAAAGIALSVMARRRKAGR